MDVILSWTMGELKEKLQQVGRFNSEKHHDLAHLRAGVLRWARDEAENIFFKETDALIASLGSSKSKVSSPSY